MHATDAEMRCGTGAADLHARAQPPPRLTSSPLHMPNRRKATRAYCSALTIFWRSYMANGWQCSWTMMVGSAGSAPSLQSCTDAGTAAQHESMSGGVGVYSKPAHEAVCVHRSRQPAWPLMAAVGGARKRALLAHSACRNADANR
jgi:hypothetical protein